MPKKDAFNETVLIFPDEKLGTALSWSWPVGAALLTHAAFSRMMDDVLDTAELPRFQQPGAPASRVCFVVSDPDTAGPGPFLNIIGYGPFKI